MFGSLSPMNMGGGMMGGPPGPFDRMAGLIGMLRAQQGGGGMGPSPASRTMPQPPPPDGESTGLINRALGIGGPGGVGLLNKLFGQRGIGAPMNLSPPGGTVPNIPPVDMNAPGPNALTGMW